MVFFFLWCKLIVRFFSLVRWFQSNKPFQWSSLAIRSVPIRWFLWGKTMFKQFFVSVPRLSNNVYKYMTCCAHVRECERLKKDVVWFGWMMIYWLLIELSFDERECNMSNSWSGWIIVFNTCSLFICALFFVGQRISHSEPSDMIS